MMCCDLSGEATECLRNDIEREEFDLCEGCPLAETLSSRGRLTENADELQDEYEETLI